MSRLAYDPARTAEQEARDLETLDCARGAAHEAAKLTVAPSSASNLGALLARMMSGPATPPDGATDTKDVADRAPASSLDRLADRAEQRANRHTLAFKSAWELIDELKPTDWLVKKILARDSLALIFSEPKVGKSLLVIDIAFRVATGTDWNGRRTYQAPVFYIAGEGHWGIGKRFKAWSIHHGIDLQGVPVFASNMGIALTHPEAATEAITIVQELMAKHGRPGLIVLDTVARNFGPGDENSTRDMSAFVAACDELRVATRACVLLVHHSGHGDKSRARGSIALKGALDFEYALVKDAPRVITLHCTAIKDFEPPEPMTFRICPVDLGTIGDEGEPETSAVLTPALHMKSPASGKAGRGKNQTIALRALREGIAAGEAKREAQGLDPDGAFLTIAEWRERCEVGGITGNRFREVVRSLERQGLIRTDGGKVVEQDPEFQIE